MVIYGYKNEVRYFFSGSTSLYSRQLSKVCFTIPWAVPGSKIVHRIDCDR